MDLQKLKRNFERSLYAAWVAGSLAALYDATLTDWRLWVVVLPACLMVTLFNQTEFELD